MSKENDSLSAEHSGPYPAHSRPTYEECSAVVRLLSNLHGVPTKGSETMPVLDSLVRTILSQNTTDKLSRQAFENLKRDYKDYLSILHAKDGEVEACIRCGGLANTKMKNIRSILQFLLTERKQYLTASGEPSFEYLRDMPTYEVKKELLSLKGVGPKTVSCVLMFNLHREDFPVDTHVWEISKRLNWCPPYASREKCYLHLNSKVPNDLKYPLHILLVEHGKRCRRCSSNGTLQLPEDGPCPLVNLQAKVFDGAVVDGYKDEKKRKAETNPFAIFELQDHEKLVPEKKRLFHIDMQGIQDPEASADSTRTLKETKSASKKTRLLTAYDSIDIAESKE